MNMRELHHDVYGSPSNSKKILQSRNIIVLLEFTTETWQFYYVMHPFSKKKKEFTL